MGRTTRASWTRNAEAAQLSSLPVILLVVVGTMAPALPLGVLVAWLVLSLWLVRRSFAWEPRT